jgi:hypothetical protein
LIAAIEYAYSLWTIAGVLVLDEVDVFAQLKALCFLKMWVDG